MRDRETIDSDLRRVAAELRAIRERGGRPSSQQVDALLDERLGHPVEVFCDTAVLDEILAPFADNLDRTRRSRRGRVLSLALRAAVPLSVLTVAAVLAVMFMVHRHHRAAEPAAFTSSEERPNPVPQSPSVPAGQPSPDIAEKAMVDVLQREGVPVPNSDYASTQGHAVCDFLGKDASFSDASQFVQRTTIWDAPQSTDFTAAAVVTYCPQFETTANEQAQQTFQKSASDLQAIEGDLEGLNHDLQGISDGLHGGDAH